MIDFVLPSLGADMDEAMLVAWLVEPGDTVSYGQVIAEVETDKGVIEVECWHDGVIEEILREPGAERLPVGTPLARIGTADSVDEAIPSSHPGRVEEPQEREDTVGDLAAPGRHGPSPPIRHLAHTLGVEIDDLEGTGPDGAVTRDDIRRATVDDGREPAVATVFSDRAKASPRARRLAADQGIDLEELMPARADGLITASDVAAGVSAHVLEEEPEDKALAMRRAIARSMSRSKREIPHYYLSNQIDLERALEWLEIQNEERPITERILPAVLLLKAAARAVREVPELNGFWLAEQFQPAESVHLGVAISLREGGLVAPAIHDADTLGLDEMMRSLQDLVKRARSWRLRGSEMSDPTITVTNLGDRGVDMAFPVIIPPQVAMVGFGKVMESVVVEEGRPSVHPTVQATLAADHRSSDGHRGGLFLSALERLLQEPEAL